MRDVSNGHADAEALPDDDSLALKLRSAEEELARKRAEMLDLQTRLDDSFREIASVESALSVANGSYAHLESTLCDSAAQTEEERTALLSAILSMTDAARLREMAVESEQLSAAETEVVHLLREKLIALQVRA